MKRFQFRLESLLGLRRQKDRLAEARQLRARQAWEAARTEVETLLGQLVESAAVIEARLGQTIGTDLWLAQYQHMTMLRLAVDRAEARAKRASAEFEEANRRRRITATELEALQLLREEQWQEHRHEAAQSEQKWLDDAYLHRREAGLATNHEPTLGSSEA